MKLNVKNELLDKKNFNWEQIFRKKIATFVMSLCFSVFLSAQTDAFQSVFYQRPSVHTIRLTLQDSWKQQYVYDFDNNSTLDILLSFDELYADSHQLYFTLRHCDISWQPDEMMSIEYWDGFEKQYDCSEYHLSFNTTVDYVHYVVRIPVAKFKMSGNYILSVYSVDDDELMLSRPIMLAEHEVGLQSNVKRTNDDGTQELMVSIHGVSSSASQYLPSTLSVCSWQNNDFSSLCFFKDPDIIRGDDMVFLTPLVYQGGSEWRWADTRSLRGHVISNTRVEFVEDYFHASIPVAEPALGYSYHEDFNGLQYIHTYDTPGSNPDTSADYCIAHIFFEADNDVNDLYVVGDMVDAPFPVAYAKMDYIEGTKNMYETSFFVKQSLANFRIVEVNKDGVASMENTESNFSETENDYHICLYHRDPSTGYYRLLGYRKHNTLKTPNSFIH